MARPSKTYAVLTSEKKSHRTKEELKEREENEKAALSGIALKERAEVQSDKNAHKEFLRVKKILEKTKKLDDVYGSVINRYCLLASECMEFEQEKSDCLVRLKKIEGKYDEMEEPDSYVHFSDYIKTLARLQATVVALDKQIQAKRKMLLDIEKENGMTIAAALRIIPKSSPEKEDPVMTVLKKRG